MKSKRLKLFFSQEAERYFADGRRSQKEKELILEKCTELRKKPLPPGSEDLLYGSKRLNVGNKKILYEYVQGEKVLILMIAPQDYISSLAIKY